jgi:hypothetical protein
MAVPALAQDPGLSSSAPANLAHVEGVVDVVHEGVTERADPPMLLVDGDLVRTRNGRAEIVFADGTLLHMDHDAELEMLAPERIRVLAGRVLLRMTAAAARPYVIDTPAATVRFDSSGEYALTAGQGQGHVEVSVARGSAEIDDGSQRIRLRSGEMLSLAAAGARPYLQPFNSARFDAFGLWSNDRTHGFAAARSAPQLPYELRPYSGVLDQYGRWDYMAPYGQVWFPSVGAAWRPYYEGSWAHTRYGWTWHGRDRWAWPTHHYGRWGFNGNFWFWIPANVWAPAWVSWGFAPGFVSWSPLGWDGRPAVGFWRRDHPAYWPDHNPWRSWTVVPREHFGRRRLVRTHAIDGGRLDESTRRAWVVQNTGPGSPAGNAVPRGTSLTPGATRADTAVPTSSVPGAAGYSPRGAGRREDVEAPRPGNVRRPAGYPAQSAGDPTPPSAAPIQRATDAPAYAAPRASGGARRAPDRAPEAVPVPVRGGSAAPGRRATDAPAYAPPTAFGGARRAPDRAPEPAAAPAAPPPAVHAPAGTGARPRDAERATTSPAERPARPSGGYVPEASRPAPRGDRPGAVREAPPAGNAPRAEPARATPPQEGGARPRGGAPAPQAQSGQRNEGGARRRPPN